MTAIGCVGMVVRGSSFLITLMSREIGSKAEKEDERGGDSIGGLKKRKYEAVN